MTHRPTTPPNSTPSSENTPSTHSHEPSHDPRPQSPTPSFTNPDHVASQWADIPPQNRLDAQTRIKNSRKTFIPHSLEYQVSNHVAQESDIPLRDDFLYLSLTPISLPWRPITCISCSSPFEFPKNYGWRVHGCGHTYHTSCFRSPLWRNLPTNNQSPKDQKPCPQCSALRHQCHNLPHSVLLSRLDRLENTLLPWGVDPPPSSHANPTKKIPPEDARKRGKEIEYEAKIRRQKEEWRKSMPPGVDIAVLENAWSINPSHPIFRKL